MTYWNRWQNSLEVECFDAPGFNDVKQKFTNLFNYGKTTIYSAPVLNLDVAGGVELEVMEVNGTALVRGGSLGPGKHSLPLCNVTQGNVSQVSFKIEVDNINIGENKLVDIEFLGSPKRLACERFECRYRHIEC